MRGNNQKTYAPRVPPVTNIKDLGSWLYDEFRRLSASLGGDTSSMNPDDYYDKTASDARFAPIVHDHNTLYYTKAQIDAGYSPIGHNHDSRYYTETESDARFAPTVHDHNTLYYTKAQIDAGYSVIGHNHDSRYYTETESDARYAMSSWFPTLASQALKYVRVKSDSSAFEYRTPTQVRSDIGAFSSSGGTISGAVSMSSNLTVAGTTTANGNFTANSYCRMNTSDSGPQFEVQHTGETYSRCYLGPGNLQISRGSGDPALHLQQLGNIKATIKWVGSANACIQEIAGSYVSFQLVNTGQARLYFSNVTDLHAMLWQPGGQVYIWNNGSVIWDAGVSASDRRLKSNVRTIPSALVTVEKIRGVEFEWNKNMPSHMAGRRSIGVIAQELEEVLPELVSDHKGPDGEDSTKTVDYAKLTALLIEAVKELSARVKVLENESIRNNSTSTS